jgi:hypothetical protein
MEQAGGGSGKIFLDIADIIGAVGGIEQVGAGHVAESFFNGHEPAHAAHMA